MRVAVDTSVLLDVLLPDPVRVGAALALMTRVTRSGHLVACEAVWAELVAAVGSASQTADLLDSLRVEFDPIGQDAAELAGEMHRQFRKAGGKRDRVTADFLIGGHARLQADALATRDGGFHRRWFAGLRVEEP